MSSRSCSCLVRNMRPPAAGWGGADEMLACLRFRQITRVRLPRLAYTVEWSSGGDRRHGQLDRGLPGPLPRPTEPPPQVHVAPAGGGEDRGADVVGRQRAGLEGAVL